MNRTTILENLVQASLKTDLPFFSVGDTVNPKAGIRWAPSKNLLVRTSVGTGFRAPSLSDLNRPVSFGGTSSLLTDPTCVTIQNDIDSCTDIWEVERRSNPKLKPEKSRQFSLGSVLEVTPGLTPVSYTHLTLPTNREV